MGRVFDSLYVHESLRGHSRTEEIIARVPHRRLSVVTGLESLTESLRHEIPGESPRGKTSLALVPNRGLRVEACPCTRGVCGCLYRVIHLVEGCPYDCSYCILQGFLNRPLTLVYPELEKTFEELERDLSAPRALPPRYGTGELGDSLALEEVTGFARPLVEFFAGHPEAWLELKTKSADVRPLLDIPNPPGNVVISWSVNPPAVVATEERVAASLTARLSAASRVREAGYRLGFHFDPLLRFPGWEAAYRETVERIYRSASPGEVAWISLGSLRYAPGLAPVYAARYARHPILAGELFPQPPDGKYRYPQPLRIEMYRKLLGWIRGFDPDVYVYLCMESATVWRWALGVDPGADPLAVERGFPAPPGGRAELA